jgi:hypothetical protein
MNNYIENAAVVLCSIVAGLVISTVIVAVSSGLVLLW